MSTTDTLIRAYTAGATVAPAAFFAVQIDVSTGQPLAICYTYGFSVAPDAVGTKLPGIGMSGQFLPCNSW